MLHLWFPRDDVNLVPLETAAVPLVVVSAVLAKTGASNHLYPLPCLVIVVVGQDVELQPKVALTPPPSPGDILVRFDVLEVAAVRAGEPPADVGLVWLTEGLGVSHLQGVSGAYPFTLLSGKAKATKEVRGGGVSHASYPLFPPTSRLPPFVPPFHCSPVVGLVGSFPVKAIRRLGPLVALAVNPRALVVTNSALGLEVLLGWNVGIPEYCP